MSMPAAPERRWTIEEFERLLEERPGFRPRYELVDGELLVSDGDLLVTPAPSNRHGRIVAELGVRLHAYVKHFQLGEARFSPGAVRLDAQGYLEPDLYVIPAVDGKRQRAELPVNNLLLAVEVLSPSSVRNDRIIKRRYFQRHGVPEYWIIDGDGESVEIWKPNDERALLVDDRLVWDAGAPEPFVLDVREFFAEIADD